MSRDPPPQVSGLKRSRSQLSSPDPYDTLVTLPTKRAKVSFDQSIEVRILDRSDEKPFELVREEVRVAVNGHLRKGQHDDAAYEALRSVFLRAAVDKRTGTSASLDESIALCAPTTRQLKQYVAALIDSFPELKGCASLIFAVLGIDWADRDEGFVSVYVRFLGTLGTAIPGFLKVILEQVVQSFTLYSHPSPERPEVLARLHDTLRYILRLIPSASGTLAEVLSAEFPTFRTSKYAYLAYVRNLFRVMDNTPELRSDILTLITERTVKLDLDVQHEIDILGDAFDDELTSAVDEEVDDDDAASDKDSDVSDDENTSRIQSLRDTIIKLDGVMDLLFDYYTTAFTIGTRLEQDEVFESLLTLFTTYILPAYRIRHPQFLILHFAQLNTRYSARFIGHCLQLIISNTSSSIYAAAYLASFLARAANLPKYQIQQCVSTLAHQLSKYRATYENSARGPDLARYPLVYCITQALLYIFCFRWRELVISSDDADDVIDYDILTRGEFTWLPRLKEQLTQAIYSSLNPLKICCPNVVTQFAAVARHLRFLYVYPLLETNKRLELSSHRGVAPGVESTLYDSMSRRETALSAKMGEGHLQLDAFFPFDPYQLPKSRRWLRDDYVEWKGVPGMDSTGDDEDVSEAGSESESDDELEIDDAGDDAFVNGANSDSS